jgi:transposase
MAGRSRPKPKAQYSQRDILDAILWHLKNGGAWSQLPKDFPSEN